MAGSDNALGGQRWQMGVRRQDPPPTFDRREYWEDDSDDVDVTDLTDGATDVIASAESDAAAETKVRTATGDAAYNGDWNGIDSSDDPTLATLRLLHTAW